MSYQNSYKSNKKAFTGPTNKEEKNCDFIILKVYMKNLHDSSLYIITEVELAMPVIMNVSAACNVDRQLLVFQETT